MCLGFKGKLCNARGVKLNGEKYSGDLLEKTLRPACVQRGCDRARRQKAQVVAVRPFGSAKALIAWG